MALIFVALLLTNVNWNEVFYYKRRDDKNFTANGDCWGPMPHEAISVVIWVITFCSLPFHVRFFYRKPIDTRLRSFYPSSVPLDNSDGCLAMARCVFPDPSTGAGSLLLLAAREESRMSGDLIVFSYSHQDEGWKDLLRRHLNVLVRQGIVEIWTDRKIGAGDAWERNIREAIDSARVAILLISADFLSSEYIQNAEVPRILERHEKGALVMVPVLVRPCVWEAVPWLREIQMRPWSGIPLSLLPSERGEAEIAEISREVMRILGPDLGTRFCCGD